MIGLFIEFKKEVRKVFRPKIIVIYLIIILVFIAGLAILQKTGMNKNWKADANQQIAQAQEWISEYSAEKDADPTLIDRENEFIEVLQYQIDNNISTQPNFLSFTYNMFSISMVAIIFIILIASNVICVEYSNKTLPHLVMRNVKKKTVLSAKLLTVIGASLAFLISILIISLLIGLALFGTEGKPINVLMDQRHQIIETNLWLDVLNSSFMLWVELISYGIIAFFLSVLSKKSSTAIIVTMSIWLIGGTIISLLNFNNEYSFLILLNSLNSIDNLLVNSFSWSIDTLKPVLTIFAYDLLAIILSFIFFCKKTFTRQKKQHSKRGHGLSLG
jgi:ABC-type transport system involved in multi-copper enzyme maturation permease subunit